MASVTDQWADWILERRFGGDELRTRTMLEDLAAVRDQILNAAQLGAGNSLLDVGCGDGLVGFGALAREPGCTALFSDISERLVDQCRQLAESAGVSKRCRFLVAGAEDLSQLDDGSVDVVTTRSVLIYVENKSQALKEFYRVLRPGGRLSIFEPINRYFLQPDGLLPQAYDAGPVKDLADAVQLVFMRSAPSAMLDFNERDLVHLSEQAGFQEVHLRLDVDVEQCKPQQWEGFYRSSPNPLAPTIEEAVNEVLTPNDVERYVQHFRPLVERGVGTARRALAFLSARKPTAG